MKQTLLKKLSVFLTWVFSSVLGFWLMLVSRQSLLSTLAVFYVRDSMPRAWRVRFIDKAYFIVSGLALLIFVFAIEGYFSDGAEEQDLFRRFARTTGIEFLIVFGCDLVLWLIERPQGQFSLLRLGGELIVGAVLLTYTIWIKNQKST